MSTETFKVWTDGACRGNPGPASIGVFITAEDGTEVASASETIGHTTNNVAEYTAVLRALDLLEDLGATRAEFFMDSQLIVRQLSGEYRVKDAKMKVLYGQVQGRMDRLARCTVRHVPREENKQADALANAALDA